MPMAANEWQSATPRYDAVVTAHREPQVGMTELDFRSRVERGFRGWTGIVLPASSERVLGTRKQLSVVGTVNGRPVRSTAVATGTGHFLCLDLRLRRELAIEVGSIVDVKLRRSAPVPSPPMPQELVDAIERQPQAPAWWDALSPAARTIASRWVGEAKSPELRLHRVQDVLRRARRAFHREGPFFPTREDQPVLARPRGAGRPK